MKVTVSKDVPVSTFCVEATDIKTSEDVKEVIRQLQLIEGQIADGLGFEIVEGKISNTVFKKGRFVTPNASSISAEEAKENLTISANEIDFLTCRQTLKGTVTFLNLSQPLCITFTSPITGENLGTLKEKDGSLTFEGKADEAAKLFFAELAKNNINPNK